MLPKIVTLFLVFGQISIIMADEYHSAEMQNIETSSSTPHDKYLDEYYQIRRVDFDKDEDDSSIEQSQIEMYFNPQKLSSSTTEGMSEILQKEATTQAALYMQPGDLTKSNGYMDQVRQVLESKQQVEVQKQGDLKQGAAPENIPESHKKLVSNIVEEEEKRLEQIKSSGPPIGNIVNDFTGPHVVAIDPDHAGRQVYTVFRQYAPIFGSPNMLSQTPGNVYAFPQTAIHSLSNGQTSQQLFAVSNTGIPVQVLNNPSPAPAAVTTTPAPSTTTTTTTPKPFEQKPVETKTLRQNSLLHNMGIPVSDNAHYTIYRVKDHDSNEFSNQLKQRVRVPSSSNYPGQSSIPQRSPQSPQAVYKSSVDPAYYNAIRSRLIDSFGRRYPQRQPYFRGYEAAYYPDPLRYRGYGGYSPAVPSPYYFRDPLASLASNHRPLEFLPVGPTVGSFEPLAFVHPGPSPYPYVGPSLPPRPAAAPTSVLPVQEVKTTSQKVVVPVDIPVKHQEITVNKPSLPHASQSPLFASKQIDIEYSPGVVLPGNEIAFAAHQAMKLGGPAFIDPGYFTKALGFHLNGKVLEPIAPEAEPILHHRPEPAIVPDEPKLFQLGLDELQYLPPNIFQNENYPRNYHQREPIREARIPQQSDTVTVQGNSISRENSGHHHHHHRVKTYQNGGIEVNEIEAGKIPVLPPQFLAQLLKATTGDDLEIENY